MIHEILAPGIEVYCGDCLEVMKTFAKESVEAIVTDPPYNVSVKNARITRRDGTIYKAKNDIALDFGGWDHGDLLWTDYIQEFIGLLNPTGVLAMFYDKLYLGQIEVYLQEQHGFQFRHIGNWVKRNPAPQARKVKWQNGCESFLVSTKNKGAGHHFNYKLGQSPDYFLTSVNYKHLHPTQKPLEVMEWIVNYWSFPGDTILDPFMGSGTTGVACARLSRNFIGIEKDEKYYAIAKQRILTSIGQPMTDENKSKQADMFSIDTESEEV